MRNVATPAYCQLMARYNSWVNEALYSICAELPEEEQHRSLPTSFGSVLGILNHLLYSDRVWFGRFTGEISTITNPEDEPYFHFEELYRQRQVTDAAITAWANTVTAEQLSTDFVYRSRTLPLGVFVVHFFNHQTNHRGQVSILLTLLGHEPMLTDISFMPLE